MVGCHRNSRDDSFRDFGYGDAKYDELAIWTRKLRVNRTHDETLYFTGGYSEKKKYFGSPKMREEFV